MSDVKEVLEITQYKEVNRFLEIGWVLLAIAAGQWSDTQEAYIRYSLGWVQELPAKRPD